MSFSKNPQDASLTFMMICLLGTIMVTPLKSALRFSGSSCLPA